MERVIISRPWIGITAMQVCAVADATDEEILAYARLHNSAGTSNNWMVVVREHNAEDYQDAVPVQCEDHPDRKHFILIC